MNISLSYTTIEKYFNFLVNLDDLSKKRLIKRLTDSFKNTKKNNIDLKKIAGQWDDTRSSDEIILELKNARIEKLSNINF